VPVMKVADAEEAIRLANDSDYGLGASVWTKDLARGEQIARRIESGYACVNDANVNYCAYELPMGGWKSSGLGVRHGAAGIRKYTRQQAILVTRLAMKRDVHFFPYTARTTKLLGRLTKLLYGVGATDVPTFVGVAGVLLAVTLAACLIPARRALRVDPLEDVLGRHPVPHDGEPGSGVTIELRRPSSQEHNVVAPSPQQ